MTVENGNGISPSEEVIAGDGAASKGNLDRKGLMTPDYIRDSRFGGLAGIVEASVSSSIDKGLGKMDAPYPVTPVELGDLSQERTREALAHVLELGCNQLLKDADQVNNSSVETSDPKRSLANDVMRLVAQIRADLKSCKDADEHSPEVVESDKNADMAANVLTSVLLRSSPTTGIDPREVEHRKLVFGSNAISDKKLDSFLMLCWEAVQDFVLIMLIVLATISIVVELTTHKEDDGSLCKTCWIEGAAILVSVAAVVLITAGLDYAKQFAFIRLTKSVHETNTKQVIRDGQQVSVIDDDIVVGDILSVNSHNLASIPCDCVLLGPATADLSVNESSLTGESKLIRKKPGDVVLSGTSAASGSGKMVVVAVGVNSVAGKIKARVYESGELEGELEGEDANSPLFVKLDLLAKRIGVFGSIAAAASFTVSCIVGLGFEGDEFDNIVGYIVTAITVLAVAVPEGLPLAVTLALAFSSNKMAKEQNLVKHLDACETMGCATTICTDKTGTLTANQMSARAVFTCKENYLVLDPATALGSFIKDNVKCPSVDILKLIATTISIDTMNESFLHYKEGTTKSNRIVEGGSGNPTEVALLHAAHDLGYSYEEIRDATKGRSDKGALGAALSEGRQFGFSSARKMMSWAVPTEGGGYRIYTKGAAEVIIGRCSSFITGSSEVVDLTNSARDETTEVSLAYARRGMRCIALAFRDLPAGFNIDQKCDTIKNSDGTPANLAETSQTFLALFGIEDPLRPEVPGAIEKCYKAGIDVRMVTGDNPNTAVSIAYQAGILRDFHFLNGTTERVAVNLKENVLLEGKVFRSKVYKVDKDGEKEFDQVAFDQIWPHLRVLARSSPDDKLTLAHGLNQSNLFADKATCQKLLTEDKIKIFPDRQVVAMTGDGTNDAPALKRADIGFAMGVAGTQIAKDAADIILLDDNFASIVTAAKWGRNIYASIQKFLQFQLTVNIAAVVTALVGSFMYQESPLAAIQLLWVNLIMDSMASVALASEPPVDALLEKPPVNRSDSMITKRMQANMCGHAFYQIGVTLFLLFKGVDIFSLDNAGHQTEENTEHYTIIFNSFVWMQLFNEINCRNLKGEFNVFSGINRNPFFIAIWLFTAILQIILIQFGSVAFKVYEGGLSTKYWVVSIAIGAFSLIVQQIINVFYYFAQQYNLKQNEKKNA